MLRIKLIKSPIGNNWRNRRTVIALGLHKVHQVVEQPDNPSIQGMIQHVRHMLSVEVVEGDVVKKAAKVTKAPKEVKPVKAKKDAASPAKPKAKPAAKPKKKDEETA